MPLTIEHIETAMAGDGVTPGQLSDFRVYLAALASMNEAQICKIEDIEAQQWQRIREHKNSDRAADREWQATELGQRQRHLKSLNKRIDILTRALSAKLRVKELEARNQF